MGRGVDFLPDKPRALPLGNCFASFLSRDHRDIVDISYNLQGSMGNSEIPEVDPRRFDLVVMTLTMRDFLGDATKLPKGQAELILASFESSAQAISLLADCMEVLTLLFDRLHQKIPALPVFITSNLIPSFNSLGDMVGRNDLTEPQNFLLALNEKIYEVLASYDNFYFVEMNEIVALIGGQHVKDDRTSWSTHASFLPAVQWKYLADPFGYLFQQEDNKYGRDMDRLRIEFWSKISTLLSIIRQEKHIKMIIVDLDDTLWKGVATEDTMTPAERIEGWPLGFVEALIYFKKRGGLLAICSKNDLQPTLDRMVAIWNGAIQPKNFASIRINWRSKPENIAEILTETMTMPKNTLLIDGNSREINEVLTRFPEMECLGPPQEKWRRIILQDARFQRLSPLSFGG